MSMTDLRNYWTQVAYIHPFDTMQCVICHLNLTSAYPPIYRSLSTQSLLRPLQPLTVFTNTVHGSLGRPTQKPNSQQLPAYLLTTVYSWVWTWKTKQTDRQRCSLDTAAKIYRVAQKKEENIYIYIYIYIYISGWIWFKSTIKIMN